MPILFSIVHTLFTDIIFTEFGKINNLKLPLLYLDKLASYDVIIPNNDSSISTKLPTVMINVLTKSHRDNCRGRILLPRRRKSAYFGCKLSSPVVLKSVQILQDLNTIFRFISSILLRFPYFFHYSTDFAEHYIIRNKYLEKSENEEEENEEERYLRSPFSHTGYPHLCLCQICNCLVI